MRIGSLCSGYGGLAAPFAEWMMFLPEGWVTSPEIGLTRPEQLKAIGNGVVPPQAFAAFRHLLSLQVTA
jgi:DNA (cytosine-5)-methyltransferase 1